MDISCMLAPAANHDALSDPPPSFLSTLPTPTNTSHFCFIYVSNLSAINSTCEIHKAKKAKRDRGYLKNIELQERATFLMIQPKRTSNNKTIPPFHPGFQRPALNKASVVPPIPPCYPNSAIFQTDFSFPPP